MGDYKIIINLISWFIVKNKLHKTTNKFAHKSSPELNYTHYTQFSAAIKKIQKKN